ncbi:MAG: hypothetical protein A3F92_05045 [Candidatus Rokubacteria bacterium RIFCSPLOWO2_12_FULL_71_22]|nr:MAG: hypothetical protein A3F92_05045 [Candidatus Rokubacteria bacterium RIFCSPLOWO2_12_FULL_71_22]
MNKRCVWLGALLVLAALGPAWADEPVAYITEIQRTDAGDVEVKLAGDSDWRPSRPLLALRPGDQVRARGTARAVVLFHAGGGTQVVAPESSPLSIGAPATTGGVTEQLRVLTAGVGRFLMGKQDPPQYRRLSTRSVTLPPVIVAPRNTRLLARGPVFEWEGSSRARYALRVVGPGGVLWEQADVPRAQFAYPATAPRLTPGVRYTWELEVRGHQIQRAEFELVPDAEAQRVRDALAALAGARGYSPGTLALMRAVVLYEAGLYDDARRETQGAATAAPRDPTPVLLLGYVYERMGLASKAAEAFDRAKVLAR